MARDPTRHNDPAKTQETVPMGRRGQRVCVRVLRKGTQLGRYRVLDKLGVGGTSIVYVALDPVLERKVAIKLLQTARARVPRARRRLLREAKAIARLSHPNIVAVHDVGVHEGQLYVAMELVEGETLRRWQQHPRSWREVLDVYLAAGRGLVAAHRAGVVHRDFKPENVVVGGDGFVRVLDFGLAASHNRGGDPESETADEFDSVDSSELAPLDTIEESDPTPDARAHEERATAEEPELPLPLADQETELKPMRLTESGDLMGTPLYMSPEQHRAERTDARTDQFSFCAALFEGLYRLRPFGDDQQSIRQLGELKAAGAFRDPPAPSDVPARIWPILRRGLAPQPGDRWPSLEHALVGLARDPSAARRRWLYGLGAAVALAGSVALLTAHLSSKPDSTPCQNGAEQLRGIWDDQSRSSTRSAFTATGAPYADTTLTRVELALDTYSAAWVDGYEQACLATHVHETQSPQLLDRRLACLQVRLTRLRALTRAFVEADARTVLNAAAAVTNLPDVALCADAAAMIASTPLPDSDADRVVVHRLRERLAEAAILRDAGRDADALTAAQQIAKKASEVGYLPIEAEAQLMLGNLLHVAGDASAAYAALDRAIWAAEASSHDHVAARGWTRAAHVAPLEVRGFAARRAEAAIVRTGLDELRATLASGIAAAHMLRGEYEEALAKNAEALRLSREHGFSELRQSYQINNLAAVLSRMGRYEEALARYQQSYRHAEEALGEDHPAVGFLLNNVGATLIELGRYDEAGHMLERALPLSEVRGEGHRQLAYSLLHLGWLRLHQQRFAAAQSYLERSLRVWEALGLEELHRPVGALGALAEARGDYRSARELFERAVAVEVAEGGSDHPDVAKSRAYLGRVLVRLGELDRADALLAQAREAGESSKARRADRGLMAGALGLLAERRGQLSTALARYTEALEANQVALGERHPSLVVALHGMCRCHLAANRPGDAIPLLRRALRLGESTECPPRTRARTAILLARALASSGQGSQATELARAASSELVRAEELGAHADDAALEQSIDRLLRRVR